MIVIEKINEKLSRRYSDAGVYIRQIETGNEYVEAVDVEPCAYTYEETEKIIKRYTEVNET